MTNLVEKLARIDELLARIDPSVRKTLRPGASAAKLAKLAKAIAIPGDVATFFRWHDGQIKPSQLHPEDNHTPLSVDEALEAWKFLCDPDEDIQAPWSKAWLPVMTNGAGDYLCVDTTKKGAGKLVAYYHDDARRPVQFASLAAWADKVAAKLAKRTPVVPSGRRLALDGSATTWKARKKPPTQAQLAKLPVGAAISWKTVMPRLGGAITIAHVFVKVEPTGEKPWRKATHHDEAAAIGRIQEYAAQPKSPEDSFWKDDDFSVAFNAKETNFDDTVDDPVPIVVHEATVVVRFD